MWIYNIRCHCAHADKTLTNNWYNILNNKFDMQWFGQGHNIDNNLGISLLAIFELLIVSHLKSKGNKFKKLLVNKKVSNNYKNNSENWI